jgi:hypothetical protein
MEKKIKLIEVRTADGKPIISFQIFEKEIEEKKDIPPEKEAGAAEEKNQKDNHNGNEPSMTDAQKRYLFRLLAGVGFEGEAAHEELRKRFGVKVLKKVSKVEASREIERLLEGQRKKQEDEAPEARGGASW